MAVPPTVSVLVAMRPWESSTTSIVSTESVMRVTSASAPARVKVNGPSCVRKSSLS